MSSSDFPWYGQLLITLGSADLANLSNRSQADFSKLASSLDFVRHPYRGRLNRSPDWASRKLASATIKSFAPFGPLCARNCASAFRRGSRIVAPRGRFWSARPRSRSIALRVASHEFTLTFPAQKYATSRHVPQALPIVANFVLNLPFFLADRLFHVYTRG